MFPYLMSFITALFIGAVFLNFFIRWKVWKYYQLLSRNQVEFDARQLFQTGRLEEEVIPRYPGQAENIRAFARNLKLAIRMTTVIVAVITLMGAILMYYRNSN